MRPAPRNVAQVSVQMDLPHWKMSMFQRKYSVASLTMVCALTFLWKNITTTWIIQGRWGGHSVLFPSREIGRLVRVLYWKGGGLSVLFPSIEMGRLVSVYCMGKGCTINLINWENFAADRSAWWNRIFSKRELRKLQKDKPSCLYLAVTDVFWLRLTCSATSESIPGLTDGSMVPFDNDGQTTSTIYSIHLKAKK